MPKEKVLDINEIIKHQRNRYPVLLIDKILDLILKNQQLV